MTEESATVDRRPQQFFTLAFLLMWGMMAAVLCAQSLSFRAVTRAIVVDAHGLSSLQYQYTYTIAGQTCHQTVDQEPPLPKAGTEIQIHYDPDSICDNVTYDPGVWGVVMGLAWMIASIPFIIWIWPWKGPD